MSIHHTALIEDGATIGDGVVIGAYCHIGPEVILGDNVQVSSHVVVGGNTRIGANTRIFPFACVGLEPQDLKYAGELVSVEIGENCIIRENVTIHPGTQGGISKTIIGNKCTMLAGSHVAHDCVLGNEIILSNNVMLAGHVQVGDRAILGGGSAVHQFARIGTGAFVGGLAGVEHDLLPFAIAIGHRASIAGPNVVGLRRAGLDKSDIRSVRQAYKILFESGKPFSAAVEELASHLNAKSHPLLGIILDFVQKDTSRAYCTMRRKG